MPETIKKRTTRTTAKKPAKKAAPRAVHTEKESVKKYPAVTNVSGIEKTRETETTPVLTERYFEDIGRRKTACARVRLFTKPGNVIINGKPYGIYFPTLDLQKIVEDSLKEMKLWDRFRVSVVVSGGGAHAQAEAVRHGLARCLIKFNHEFRKRLKRAGFLTRDPRMKERKKFGLKKARRAPQWQKR